MKKLFVSMVSLAALVFTVNAFAYTGHGFKIISEKETSTPGFNGHHMDVTGMEKKSLAPVSTSFGAVTSSTSDKQGHVREHVRIESYHSVNITNYTQQKQRYTYSVNLNCEQAYYSYDKTVELEPGGVFNTSDYAYGDVQKWDTGTFRINAATKLTGESSGFHESHAVLRVLR